MTYQRFLLLGAAVVAAAFNMQAAPDVNVLAGEAALRNVTVEHTGTKIVVAMDIDVAHLNPGNEGELVLTPVIRDDNGNECVLPKVAIAGRARYFRDLRNKTWKAPDQLFRKIKSLASIQYQTVTDYQDWMEVSTLAVDEGECRCSSTNVLALNTPLLPLDYRPQEFEAELVYITPEVEEVKARALCGQAFIDFPVNQTIIYPDYRGNTAELAKIIASIDSVRNDPDITVTSLSIKGYASPEGPYNNNIRLAKGRTEALKNYVEGLYNFLPGFIKTSYEPEDWEGLRRYVEGSEIANRDGILALIDSSLAPDAKDARIKRDFPEQYAFLLKNVYPALRHSDYTIEYVIRAYTSASEIAAVMASTPQKLSLQEMMVLAASLQPGSDEYNEVFETAVRMYPESDVANLNAGINATSYGNYDKAELYLAKAGNTPQATYARGVLAAHKGDYETAITLLTQALNEGVVQASNALQRIQDLNKR